MSEQSTQLNQLQRWMQAVITDRGGIEPGMRSDEARRAMDVAPDQIETVVSPSRALSSIERLAIYGDAYYARLVECMRETFPCLAYALGEEIFNEFARSYLQQHPPTSYTLTHLADHFVSFLQNSRPDAAEQVHNMGKWPDFIIDLASLEWHIDQVFDGPGVEGQPLLAADQLTAIPEDLWPSARLEPVACLRLLPFTFPVNTYYTAYREGNHPEMPTATEEFVALTRRDYVVWRFGLSKPQYQLLRRLVDGRPVGDAIASAANELDDVARFAVDLRDWFTAWSAAGFFQQVRVR